MASKEDTFRSRVYKFYSDNIEKGKLHTVRHFQAEGVPKWTVYRILTRFHNNLPASRQPGSGGSNKKMTPRKLAALRRAMDNRDGISQRQAAKKFGCHQSTIQRSLEKLNIKARKKQRIPQRSAAQISNAKKLSGRLFRKFGKVAWIIDDESYFTLSHSTISGNQTFYTSDINATPPSVKFSPKTKFEKKVLVWIAIGPNGMSEPLIKESKFAINGQVYLEDCIKSRLLPYIRTNYDDNYVFWPDKASSHYSKVVIEHLDREGVNYVAKEDNPANLPEARSIEDFWEF
ncbi:unnamed protein product [Darwinula stevensoni]|uniref:Uncharacterized protein n=1 Tax=Darwinula stevensoni TaxID=69355 RepID=A0A7R8X4M3_9CRUS|nr:unnamed protein product [Darwinula stevensoni]CAG0879817.1 unnamed protein product [Darwinula stevensoni]